jgi:hypothetical protein
MCTNSDVEILWQNWKWGRPICNIKKNRQLLLLSTGYSHALWNDHFILSWFKSQMLWKWEILKKSHRCYENEKFEKYRPLLKSRTL